MCAAFNSSPAKGHKFKNVWEKQFYLTCFKIYMDRNQGGYGKGGQNVGKSWGKGSNMFKT